MYGWHLMLRSRDLEDQIYPLDGATVEDMYHKSWINTVGGLFQFGRLYMSRALARV